MGDNTLYANLDGHMVGAGGGALVVSVTGGTNAQGNGGTSLPCRVVLLNAVAGDSCMVGITNSLTASLGVLIPTYSVASAATIGALEMAIDDVSRLWFSSAAAASVHITYRY